MLTRMKDHQGFTLIELLVVIAIIAILAAIAIPNFMGMRIRAYNSAANTEAGNARIAEETYQTDEETYTGTYDPNLKDIDANLFTTDNVRYKFGTCNRTQYEVVTWHLSGNRSYGATEKGIFTGTYDNVAGTGSVTVEHVDDTSATIAIP